MSMDWQIGLVSVGFCLFSGLVVYLISVFGMKEKTYEEAIEEQRKRNQVALQLNKTEKPKKEKKFKKTSNKKSKEAAIKSNVEETNSEQETPSTNATVDRVDFKTETEIIPSESDPEQTKSSTVNKRKKSKQMSGAPKSILINKSEISHMSPPTPTPDDHDEEYSMTEPPAPAFVPKDEVERRHSQDAEAIRKASAQLIANQQLLQDIQEANDVVVVEEVVSKQLTKLTNQDQPQSSPSKKNKKSKPIAEETVADAGPPTGKRLMSWLKSVHLQDDEIQVLIDVLLNKQHEGAAEWTKRNDPVQALKKQLQEREATLEAEQRQTVAVNSKLRDLRHELGQEKTRYSASERILKDKMTQQQQELQTLHARLQQIQHAHEQQMAENAALQGKQQQLQIKMSDDQNMALQRLSEENNKLQQKLSRLDSERQNWTGVENQMQMKLNQMQTACERYEANQLAQQQEQEKLESRLQQLLTSGQEGEYKYTQRIAEISQKMADTENRYSSLVQEAQRAKSVAVATDQDRVGLVNRLEQTETAARKYEAEVKQLKELLDKEKLSTLELQNRSDKVQSQVGLTASQLAEANRIANSLTEENQRLKADLDKANQGHQNGDIIENKGQQQLKTNPTQDHTRILKEKEDQLKSLEESLQRQKNFLTSVSEDLDTQKRKNNELREKNWKAMEALTVAEKSLKEESVKREELQSQEEESRKRLGVAQTKCDQLGDSVAKERVRERDLLRSLLPQADIDPKLEHSKWLEQFVSVTRQRLTTVSVTSPTPPPSPGKDSAQLQQVQAKLTHLKAENSSLQAQINHYKTVLAETEDILKKLQSGVEAEEMKWKDKLNSAETRLNKAMEEKKKLEKNLEELQGIEEATSEMQSRLKELQSKLQGEENEKKSLEQKFEQANKCGSDLNKQLEENRNELELLRKEKEETLKAQIELEGVRTQLEKERKVSKDLSSQTVKLNSLVKIGQDALKAEQELVKELQRQIEIKSTNSSSESNVVGGVSPARATPTKNGDLLPAQTSNGSPSSLANSLNQSEAPPPITTPTLPTGKSDKSSKHKKRGASGKK